MKLKINTELFYNGIFGKLFDINYFLYRCIPVVNKNNWKIFIEKYRKYFPK